ncbi:MAG: citrate (Si)-synthase [SAR202 cluster bacterium]|nr:citrate (Si)-synthase [SAR202 cluster bacterium]|tara:strand:- start:28293 stop:29429 length:1137 start_codon:yes stop_codon:yes gene_type:complete
MTSEIEIKRGLQGVYIDRSKSSFIDGTEGKLLYRGYSIHDLAEKSSFEEIAYLLLYGELPNKTQLEDFDSNLRDSRSIPAEVIEIIRVVKDSHPMDVLRTAVSALSAYDNEVADNSVEATIRKGIRLTAQAPTIVTAHARIKEGKDPVSPNSNLNQAANFLYMLFGEEPTEQEARLMEKDFVIHAEHGINASAFAARVAASTNSDLHSAVVSGIGTLKGPAHGGAAEEVMAMALEIGEEEKAESYVRNILDGGGRIMGFGHRVYKVEDPRARHLQTECQALGDQKGQPKWFRILSKVAEVMEPYQSRGICPNVDFWAGAMYHLMGIPKELFICIFAMGRIPGWTAQVTEQFSNNILLRPLLLYDGPMDLPYVPLDDRK